MKHIRSREDGKIEEILYEKVKDSKTIQKIKSSEKWISLRSKEDWDYIVAVQKDINNTPTGYIRIEKRKQNKKWLYFKKYKKE